MENITEKEIIYKWFEFDAIPTEEQFRATWDSFWHKSESLPMSSVDGLTGRFNQTASKTAFENHTNDGEAHNLVLAKRDASNLSATNVSAWKTKLGVGESIVNIVSDSTIKGDGKSDNPLGLSDEKNAEIVGKLDKPLSAITSSDTTYNRIIIIDSEGNSQYFETAGAGERLLAFSATGQPKSELIVEEEFETDSDLITAIKNATYTSNIGSVSVAGKTLRKGKMYVDSSTGYLYIAFLDNTIIRK